MNQVGRPTGLAARTGPAVQYVRAEGARHAPAGMHVEYVPGVWPVDVSVCVPPPCYHRLHHETPLRVAHVPGMQHLLTCVCYLLPRSHFARSQNAGCGSRTRTITAAARRPLDLCA